MTFTVAEHKMLLLRQSTVISMLSRSLCQKVMSIWGYLWAWNGHGTVIPLNNVFTKCLICSSEYFIVVKATSFSRENVRRFYVCMNDRFGLLSLLGCLKGSHKKSWSSSYLVLLTLFTWLPRSCWPCQTVPHKKSLIPSSRYLCSLQFHGLLCNSTFTNCETQPGFVVWCITCCVIFYDQRLSCNTT